MNCPICKSKNDSEHSTSCPECGSDLTSFFLIDQVSKEKSNLKKSIIFAIALSIVILSGWMYTYTQGTAIARSTVHAVVTDDNTTLAEHQNELVTKDAEIAMLNSKLKQLQATIESSSKDIEETDSQGKHLLHVVKSGESLWSISELYHGHGFKQHHIGGHNQVDNSDHIEVGDTLIILN